VSTEHSPETEQTQPGVKVSTARAAEAAGRLAEVGMRRDDATLIRWLLLKWKGCGVGKPVSIGYGDCTTFTDLFFAVPGRGDYPHFNPFASDWRSGVGTNWAIQTICTQLQRLNQTEQRMYEAPERPDEPEPEAATTWQMSFRPAERYLAGLGRLMRERRVPVVELALWRYRDESLEEGTMEEDLAVRLVEELHLSQDEVSAVFSVPDPVAQRLS
jgi:hypothetical protein